jgi:hypothetical protein
MIDTAPIDEWLGRYCAAWKTDDRDEIAALFTAEVRYFTTPYSEPLEGVEAVIAYWLGEEESTVSWTFDREVVAREGDLFVVRAVTRYPEGTTDADGPEVFHNLWLVTLGPDGRAREFVEYWMPVE